MEGSGAPGARVEVSTIELRHQDDLIDSRIEVHDSNQFEVKLDYSIDPDVERNHYRVEAYFFIPKSLGISAYTYSREQFYHDIQAYIRFKTPTIELGSLVDPKNERSPLYRIDRVLPKLLRDPNSARHRRRLDHELRLFGCLVRANLRDRVKDLFDGMARPGKGNGGNGNGREAAEAVRRGCAAILGDADAVIGLFRGLRERINDPALPAVIGEIYRHVDEYLSIEVEASLTLLLDHIDQAHHIKGLLEDTRRRIAERLVAERSHRETCRYASVLDASVSREYFVYRRGMLKKFVMSVLFLEISKEEEGRRAADVGAAIAAGVAMLFATAVAIVSQARYGLNTLPFVLALVLSYVAKDRIKDWLKHYFTSKMTRWLWDYDVRIVDRMRDAVIGRCREAFSFIDRSKVPDEVIQVRHRDATSAIEVESKPEVIFKYEKHVRLHSDLISNLHGRLQDINDIIRFTVSSFVARTDDPIKNVRTYDPERDAVVDVHCPKVYHLNIVFVLRAQDAGAAPHISRVRVILDKRGIRRLEEA